MTDPIRLVLWDFAVAKKLYEISLRKHDWAGANLYAKQMSAAEFKYKNYLRNTPSEEQHL